MPCHVAARIQIVNGTPGRCDRWLPVIVPYRPKMTHIFAARFAVLPAVGSDAVRTIREFGFGAGGNGRMT